MTMLQNNCLENLAKFSGVSIREELFVPVARYFPDMDYVLYLNTDCSYRADRVDTFLTVLWHPQEDKLVGVKLKGFRFIFSQLQKIIELKDNDFVLLVKAIEIALVGGYAESLLAKVEQERHMGFYHKAIELTKGVELKIDAPLRLAVESLGRAA